MAESISPSKSGPASGSEQRGPGLGVQVQGEWHLCRYIIVNLDTNYMQVWLRPLT